MNAPALCVATLAVFLNSLHAEPGEEVFLFDGKTFTGWNFAGEEDKQWWEIRDGMIVGGSMTEKVPRNFFLATDRNYQDFELKFKVRLVKGEGFANSGVQIRSVRDAKGMEGYQVDVGPGWWGKIYDEHRRRKVISQFVDEAALLAVAKDWDWNEYRVIADGERIRTWINGVLAHDYYEKDPNIPLDGHIGLQAHGGGKFEVQFKDLIIRELPPTLDLPTWEGLKRQKSSIPTRAELIAAQKNSNFVPQSPDGEKAKFELPDGFVAELVASEEQGAGKPITVTWDTQGRLWTMTAFEYPLDANENKAQAEAKYAAGGKDKVLVIDDPYGPGPHTPREFADELVMPLGLLPYGDGALIQYGTQIRHYHDRDGDGKAEGFEAILDGFGIQDSHLFPHQFERTPGGWIYAAQGLFNYSVVRRPDGRPFVDGTREKVFNQTKLARFRPDGSMWENVTAGPNNIWGLIQRNNGETFIQEANDRGLPASEYIRGTHYSTGSREKLRDYAPQMPMSIPPVMGGTGLSGLALTEDPGNPFNAAYAGRDNVFYVVNPIINAIQVVTSTRARDGSYPWQKQADFMKSGDKMFRPVAAHFGPDGCLYVVDWYNKIISHNEVARTHPDRDKTRGRIWRIRHKDQEVVRPPNLMEVPERELIAALQSPNERLARLAWHAIVDRGAEKLHHRLTGLLNNSSKPVATRVLALWCLEDLGLLNRGLIMKHARDASPHIRFEIVRALGEQRLPETPFLKAVGEYGDDPDYRVRAELANSVRTLEKATPAMVAAVAKLGKAPLTTGTTREIYHRNFERYLARWAMETHRESTLAMLDSELAGELDSEQRLLAIQSLDPVKAAVQLARAIPEIDRPLTGGELTIISSQLDQREVAARFAESLADPGRQLEMLNTLERMDPKVAANPKLAAAIGKVCEQIVASGEGHEPLVMRLASKFRLMALEEPIAKWIGERDDPSFSMAGLTALKEMGSQRIEIFEKLAASPDADIARSATAAIAAIDDPAMVGRFASEWDGMAGDYRQLVVAGLTSNKAKSEAFASSILDGQFAGITGDSVENIIVVLGDKHPKVRRILKEIPGLMSPVLVLDPKKRGIVESNIDLAGPFTLEAWMKFDPGIHNEDNLLGRVGVADLNFFQKKFRVYARKQDWVIAQREMVPNVWTHVALTRDKKGTMRIYLDGELDATSQMKLTDDFTGLNIGETNRVNLAAGVQVREVRVWDHVRNGEQILADLHTDYGDSKPAGLLRRVSGETKGLKFKGGARAEFVSNFPKLQTPGQSRAAREKFDRYLTMAQRQGNAENGKLLFGACLACHQVKGVGGIIGPDLSGAGAMETDALLHNILTPNAKMESGYYRHDLLTKNGKFSGTLVGESKDSFTLLPAGGEPRVISKKSVLKHNISKTSLMPEGLIDLYNEQQVADLFTYLRSLGK